MKTIFAGIFAAFVLATCIGGSVERSYPAPRAMASASPPNGDPAATQAGQAEKSPAPEQAPLVATWEPVTALKLWRDYQANEVAADNKYKGNLLAVDGKVASVDKDMFSDMVLMLRTPNQFMRIRASMGDGDAKELAILSKGDRVIIHCVGGGIVIGSPILRDCAIASYWH